MSGVMVWKGTASDDGAIRDAMDFMLDLVTIAAPDREPDIGNIADDSDNRCYRKRDITTKKRKRDDGDVDDETENRDPQHENALIAEPRVPLTISSLKRRSCLICDSPQLQFLAIRNGKYEHLCSELCVEKYKKFRNQAPCQNCKSEIVPGEPAFSPNFGIIGRSVCSQRCLLQYDEQFGPKAKCRNGTCVQVIAGKGSRFHWQSMDFCSALCVKKLLRAVGAKCAECRSIVPVPSIGKYSVRFGDVVRQFCNTTCLSAHKKSHRCCYFCQTEVKSGQTSTYSSSRPVDRDFGEGVKSFCNNVCLDDFMRQDADKRLHLETETTSDLRGGNFCDICLCYFPTESPDNSPDHMYFRSPVSSDLPVFLCGTVCAAAFRFKHKINSLFCTYCYKLNWNLSTGVVLRFSESGIGRLKIFCTRRCMNLFVIRVRKLKNCASCKCCKYTFDLIEEHDVDSGSTTYFCSLVCLNIVRESRSLKLRFGHRLDVVKCYSCLKILSGQFHVSDHFDSTVVHSFCSFPCYSHYLKNPPKSAPPPPPKAKPLPVPPPASSSGNHVLTAATVSVTSSPSFAVANILHTNTTTTSSTPAVGVTTVVWTSGGTQNSQVYDDLRRGPGLPPKNTPSPVIPPAVHNSLSRSNVHTYSNSNLRTSLSNGTSSATMTTTTSTNESPAGHQESNYSITSILSPTEINSSTSSKKTLTVDLDSPLGQLCLHIREHGMEKSDLKAMFLKAQNGTAKSHQQSNVKEVLVVKEKPKRMMNAAVQVSRGSVTKAIQCKPFLVDTSVSTRDQ